MNLNFKDILTRYIDRFKSYKRKYKSKYFTEDQYNQLTYENREWFHFIRDYGIDSSEVYEEIKDNKELSKKKYLLPKDKRCPGCEDGRPYKIIKYRNHVIPVYDDDYGQQDFAIVDSEEVSGGCYNFLSHLEFMNILDYKLENKDLEEKYNLYKEVEDLFPESDNK